MTAVVFETPGLIDVRAFTIMGAHAKPNAPNMPSRPTSDASSCAVV